MHGLGRCAAPEGSNVQGDIKRHARGRQSALERGEMEPGVLG